MYLPVPYTVDVWLWAPTVLQRTMYCTATYIYTYIVRFSRTAYPRTILGPRYGGPHLQFTLRAYLLVIASWLAQTGHTQLHRLCGYLIGRKAACSGARLSDVRGC